MLAHCLSYFAGTLQYVITFLRVVGAVQLQYVITFLRVVGAVQCEVDRDGEGVTGEQVRQSQVSYQEALHMT